VFSKTQEYYFITINSCLHHYSGQQLELISEDLTYLLQTLQLMYSQRITWRGSTGTQGTKTTCQLAVKPLPFFSWKSQQEVTDTFPYLWNKWRKRTTTEQACISFYLTPKSTPWRILRTAMQATEN